MILIIDQYIKYVTYLFIVTLSVYWWRLEFGRDKEEVALVDYWWRERETVEDQLLLFHFIWDWGWLLMIVADVIPTDETKQAVVHMMEWMMSIINISCGSVIATNPQWWAENGSRMWTSYLWWDRATTTTGDAAASCLMETHTHIFIYD